MNNNGMHRKKDSARIVWDSKPRRAPNPKDIEFQTAEVVIPNPETAGQLPMTFADKLLGEEELDKQKMNRLIWGDNLLAMQALLNQGYDGKINLIYIDPPFDSKADYSHKMTLRSPECHPRENGDPEIQSSDFEITKEPSVIERLAYKDTWAGGTDSYKVPQKIGFVITIIFSFIREILMTLHSTKNIFLTRPVTLVATELCQKGKVIRLKIHGIAMTWIVLIRYRL